MSRSIKDLRELINISRLSFHGDDQPHKIDERGEISEISSHQGEKHSKRVKSTKDYELSKTSLRTSRFKQLPAISPSKVPQKPTITKAKQGTELSYQKSCDCILENIDGSFVSSWLHRSNESVQWLSQWVSTKDLFVRFAKFWLGEMDRGKQGDLIELEVGTILDEITCSVLDGIKCGKVSQQDVMSFFLLIVWEYPSRICGPQNSVFVLNTLTTLASGRKDKYRKLLSNVKFATKDPTQIHWILSVRAFALISIVTALVKFYSSLRLCSIPHQDMDKLGTKLHSPSIQDLAFDAVRLGFLEVLSYLVKENDLGISALKNNDGTTLLFYAVTCSQVDIIQYILKNTRDVDINQTSKSGNSLLHAAVNTGDSSIVKLLLEAGADVNQTNVECDGVMPLHLAIMQDSAEMVQILLDAGAQTNTKNGSHSPLELAEDLESLHIVEIIKKSC